MLSLRKEINYIWVVLLLTMIRREIVNIAKKFKFYSCISHMG